MPISAAVDRVTLLCSQHMERERMDDVHRLVKDLNQGKHGWKRSLTITAGKPCGLNGPAC